MRSIHVSLATVACTLALVVGCGGLDSGKNGKDGDNGGDADGKIPVFAKAADLPDCDEAQDGQLAYIKDGDQLKVCTAGVWQAFRGEKGESGASGQDGSDGSDGKGGKAGLDGRSLFVLDAKSVRVAQIAGFGADGVDVVLADGAYSKLDLTSGRFAVPELSCFYAKADCSGPCYTNVKPSNNLSTIAVGKGEIVFAKGGVKRDVAVAGFWDVDSQSCIAVQTVMDEAYETGVALKSAYPFALPLAVKAQ